MNLFEVVDKTKRKIRLTKEQWTHIVQEHPTINNVEEIKLTLTEPIKIKPSKYDPEKVRWYYRFNKEKKRYMLVAVRYLNGEGFVITTYYLRNIK